MVDKYRKIVEFWLEKFVEDKNVYDIDVKDQDNNILINISINNEYMGKIIGKNGNLITSIRSIINSISKLDNLFVKVIVRERENG